MSDIPEGNNSSEAGDVETGLMGESVQDYLDALLSPDENSSISLNQAVEKPPQKSDASSSYHQQPKTASEFTQRDAQFSHSENTAFTERQPLQAFNVNRTEVVAKSLPTFAEPEQHKPLPKMPLPPVKAAEPATVSENPVIEKPVINKNEQPVVKQESQRADIHEQEIAVDVEVEVEVEQTAGISATQWLDNGRPDWAQKEFECLLFSVGGLTLAVPLVELGSIYPKAEELTPIFGQIDWFMGLMVGKEEGSNIKVVNTAKVVMPERYSDDMKDQYSYIVSINNVDWGLAVDSVATAITLQPDDVKWRSSRSKRPWLAGTVVDHMCALLDISQLAIMFADYDKNSV